MVLCVLEIVFFLVLGLAALDFLAVAAIESFFFFWIARDSVNPIRPVLIGWR